MCACVAAGHYFFWQRSQAPIGSSMECNKLPFDMGTIVTMDVEKHFSHLQLSGGRTLLADSWSYVSIDLMHHPSYGDLQLRQMRFARRLLVMSRLAHTITSSRICSSYAGFTSRQGFDARMMVMKINNLKSATSSRTVVCGHHIIACICIGSLIIWYDRMKLQTDILVRGIKSWTRTYPDLQVNTD